MKKSLHTLSTGILLVLPLFCLAPLEAEAQGKGAVLAADTLSLEMKVQIRNYYASHPASGAKALPPGIRRRLERGKPLPPGIAKRRVPDDLYSHLRIAEGYELVEVGLDVLLVEVATNIIHDFLRDMIRQGPT